MYKSLRIENFKSIRSLEIDCKKINVFIGEPNAGKTNIIEAIALFTPPLLSPKVVCRYNDLTDLFYDNQTNSVVSISLDQERLQLRFKDQSLIVSAFEGISETSKATADINDTSIPIMSGFPSIVAFYKFDPRMHYTDSMPGSLTPPNGSNLGSLLLTNGKLKNLVKDIFKSIGFRLNLKPVTREILLSKEKGDEIYSFSFSNISETLKRIVFFMAALETNTNKTLVFDEPEANTFPFYTKYLAERIALDETNQYFFTTHNPYLLRSVIEKTAKNDLNVFITYMEDYETKVRELSGSELDEIWDIDIFLNLDLFLKK